MQRQCKRLSSCCAAGVCHIDVWHSSLHMRHDKFGTSRAASLTGPEKAGLSSLVYSEACRQQQGEVLGAGA